MKEVRGKRMLPKSLAGKQLIRYVFWGLLVYLCIGMTGMGVRALTEEETDSPQATVSVKETDSFVTSVAAQTFAKEFGREYLTWTVGEKKEREVRLKPYLQPGIDSQAGVRFEGMQYHSSPEEVEVWKVEAKGPKEALITLKTSTMLKPAQGEKKDAIGPHPRYLAVPIITDGQAFAVHDIPHYVMKPEPITAPLTLSQTKGETVNDPHTREDIGRFLNSFFNVYATGDTEEIAYFSKEKDLQGVKGMMNFKQVSAYEVIKPKDTAQGEYLVRAQVLFTDWLSKGQFAYPYEMKLKKENGRWIVLELETTEYNQHQGGQKS